MWKSIFVRDIQDKGKQHTGSGNIRFLSGFSIISICKWGSEVHLPLCNRDVLTNVTDNKLSKKINHETTDKL